MGFKLVLVDVFYQIIYHLTTACGIEIGNGVEYFYFFLGPGVAFHKQAQLCVVKPYGFEAQVTVIFGFFNRLGLCLRAKIPVIFIKIPVIFIKIPASAGMTKKGNDKKGE